MTGFVRLLVRRLLAEERLEKPAPALSRNRHFEVFADAQGRRAHRTYRRLRVLLRDILAAGPTAISLDRSADRERPIRLRIPVRGGTRTAYLSEEELDLLRETPDLEGRLAG